MIKARTVLKCARAVALGELQPLTLTRDYAAPLDEAGYLTSRWERPFLNQEEQQSRTVQYNIVQQEP